MEERKLILCRGIQGSGKSTWAKKWVNEDPERRVRFNNDDIRNMLGKYWVTSREPLVSEFKKTFLTKAMYHKPYYDIVIDNMNLNPKEINFYELWILDANRSSEVHYTLEFKDFFIPVEECIRRDSLRPNPIGEHVIKSTWKKYSHFIQTECIEKYYNNLRPKDDSKSNAIILDMDSTLCFNLHKRPWYGDGSAEEMIKDLPNEDVCKLVKRYGGNIIIITGRDYSQYDVTKKWLDTYQIPYTKIYCRDTGNYATGNKVKEAIIQEVLKDYNIDFIIDDDNKIVKMYRDLGLTVLQPNRMLDL